MVEWGSEPQRRITMKILAIMGSPHGGNSLEKTQRIENKLKQFGDVEFEYVHLKDNKETISQKIEEADGVIFVTPVYSMHVSYLLKRFIDRFAYNFHRPRYFGRYALAVAVSGNLFKDLIARFVGWMTGRQIDKAMANL
jgi:multimeric flavodoxin WrbA